MTECNEHLDIRSPGASSGRHERLEPTGEIARAEGDHPHRKACLEGRA